MSINEGEIMRNAKIDYMFLIEKIIKDLKEFNSNLKETIFKIRKITGIIHNEVMIKDSQNNFTLSVKRNEAYTLLTMDAIEEITKIQPDFGVASNQLKKFMVKIGVAQTFAYNEFLNQAVKALRSDKVLELSCHTIVEALVFYLSKSLEGYYASYPSFKENERLSEKKKSGYADSISILSYWFGIYYNALEKHCILHPHFSETDYLYQEYINNNLTPHSKYYLENISEQEMEKLKKDKPDSIKVNIHNMIVMHEFSRKTRVLTTRSEKFSIYNDFAEIMEIEKNTMRFFIGYEIGNPQKNIIALSKLYSYLFSSLLLNFHVMNSLKEEILKLIIKK